MEARYFYKASQAFACITIVCMALTLAFSLEMFNPITPAVHSAGSEPATPDISERVRTHKRSRKRPPHKPKESAPALPLTPAPVTVPAQPESSALLFRWLMFGATLVSTACGIITMLLGWRADRREAKAEAIATRKLARDSSRRR